ncbi:hypothetical protein PsYK624_048850 [Phanerochaete sordida]|uniref:Uncharacterized protein n=1 Tax=Phanerochaete sordida TaxID=48140 RepID=A0A9P3LC50_9APHY|nr:hypothetical protein PsYK624_048850 [Phanerochaete sordida]
MPFFARKSAAASSTTLSSVASAASTAALLAQPRPQKDFLAASGTLQSAYGFGGAAPVLPTVPSTPAVPKPAKAPKAKHVDAQKPASTPAKGQKDFEAAYGALSSMYGFGGAPVAPTPRGSK